MQKIKIGLLGYGKMGKAIDELAAKHNAEVVWRLGRSECDTLTTERIQKADVVIEFTNPESAFTNIMTCLEAGVPTISGTTGWLDNYENVANYCKENNGTFLYASNFSVGVNLFFALNQQLSKLMKSWPQYQPELSETHHIHKKDAPSGTAISLAKDILEVYGDYDAWHLGADEKPDKSLAINAFRSDDVPGTHDVTWKSSIDEIRIEHIAHSREGFASGALTAAHWVLGKKGVFNMSDVLEL